MLKWNTEFSDTGLIINVSTENAHIKITEFSLYNQDSLTTSIISQNIVPSSDNISINISTLEFLNISPKTDLFIAAVRLDADMEYAVNNDCLASQIIYHAIYYPCNIYNRILSHIKEIENPCNDLQTSGLVDELLKKKAIDLCVESGNLELACIYWNKFYKGQACSNVSMPTKKCGCHG